MAMESIIIAQPTAVAHVFQWVFVNNDLVEETVHEGSILKLAKKMQDKTLWLLIPSPHVLLTQVSLPKIKKALLPQALAFTLENQLAYSLEDLHICIGKNKNTVATISKQRLATFTLPFEEKNIKIQHIYPSILCQPIEKNTWHIMIEKHIASVRTDPTSGFSCDQHNLYEILNSHLKESFEKNNGPQRIHIQLAEESHSIDLSNIKLSEAHIQSQITVETLQVKNSLILLAKNLMKEKPGIDFREPTPKNQNGNTRFFFYYRFIVSMLSIILSLALLNKLFDYSYFSKKQTVTNMYLSKLGITSTNYRQLKEIQSTINDNTDIFNALYFEVKKSLYQYPSIIINSIQYENKSISLVFFTKNKKSIEEFIKTLSHSVKIQEKKIEKSERHWKISVTIADT